MLTVGRNNPMTRRYAAWVTVAAIVMAAALAAAPQQTASAERQLEAAVHREQVLGDLKGAIEQYKKLAQSGSRTVAAQALIRLGQCYEKLGQAQVTEARAAYERVVRDFTDQVEIVAQAHARLAALGRPRGATGLVARQVLADASDVSGVLSADGRYLRGIDGATGDVIQFDVAAGQRSRVTNKGGPEAREQPLERTVLSRDGTRIAYDSFTKDGSFRLRIRNLDGTGLRTLGGEKNAYIVPLEWSSDGTSILAYCLRDSASEHLELSLISTADGSVRVLRSVPRSGIMYHTAGVSPDGRSVAFSFVRDGNPPQADVFVMTADGQNEAVIAAHPAEDRLLQWAPDGRSVIFLSDRSGTWDIWTVRIAGGKQQGEPVLLKRDFGQDADVLGVTPDGSLYYRTSTPLGRLCYGAIDLETGKVVVPPAPVTTRYTSPVALPTWSPDGRHLAYISHPGRIGTGNNILTMRSAATGEERMLSPRLRSVDLISWAPDSRSIIARGRTSTESVPVRIDIESSEYTRLPGGNARPRLCPDGKTLLFLTPAAIMKRNLDSGEESEVVKVGKMTYDLSPDGREVVFVANDAVKAVSLNGGEPRELFRGSAQSYGLEWTRDGRYIIAIARGTQASEIWRIPAHGGAALKLDLSVPKMEAFTLHPDNRRFAFSVNEGSQRELWVLEGLVPPLKDVK
jgi:Tol biopolymer transport system component